MMKKLFCISLCFMGIALLFGLTGVMLCGGNYSELYNYGNYTENKETFSKKNIFIKNCENIEINNDTRSTEIELTYYTNSSSKYEITYTDDSIYIVGFLDGSFLDIFYDDGIEISIPQGFDVSISIEAEDCSIDIEDVVLDVLSINADDSNIDISNSTVNELYLTAEDSKVEIEDVYTQSLTINVDDCNVEIDLPRKKTEYNLTVDVKGSCNVSSATNDSLLTVLISGIDSKVNVKFS